MFAPGRGCHGRTPGLAYSPEGTAAELSDATGRRVDGPRTAGRKLAITVESLIELTSRQRRELERQVERTGAIREGIPELADGRVTVGPHA